MKKILILIVAASFMFACDTTVGDLLNKGKNTNADAEEIVSEEVSSNGRSSTNNPLYNDLILPTTGGIFRGAHFDMSREAIYDMETSRSTVSVYQDEIPEELIVTTDMGKEILDFGDITYRFDEQGLYSIKVETYNVSLEGATSVYDMIIEAYTKAYGNPTMADDGYAEFTALDEKTDYEYSIAVKNIDNVEDSYGLYLHFDLL